MQAGCAEALGVRYDTVADPRRRSKAFLESLGDMFKGP